MKKYFHKLGTAGVLLSPLAVFAQASVPAALQTAITDNAAMGVAIVTAVAVGMAVIGLLARAYSKAGVR